MQGSTELTKSFNLAKIKPEWVLSNALARELPIAIWRKPLATSYCISIGFDVNTKMGEKPLEELDNGFIFCPFTPSETLHRHFIKNDLLIKIKSGKIEEVIQSNTISSSSIEKLFKEPGHSIRFYNAHNYELPNYSNEKDLFIEYVSKAIDQIRQQQFEKVVPARKSKLTLPSDFEPYKFFVTLEKSYPNAFIYLVSHPETGTWIGATPENLISIQNNKAFKTTALAGTQQFIEGMDLVDAAWRQKEIEEQAMVSRYIINCFKKIRLREFEERGPKTVKAGNLIHLKTDFIVNMEEVNFPQLGSVMLDLLHPTSAICGMPKSEAMDFILSHEGFDREYFSGYLGPVNTENSTDIFVNLRCMKISESTNAHIYAGAGVTIDSHPEKEWMETEMKMETLLKLL